MILALVEADDLTDPTAQYLMDFLNQFSLVNGKRRVIVGFSGVTSVEWMEHVETGGNQIRKAAVPTRGRVPKNVLLQLHLILSRQREGPEKARFSVNSYAEFLHIFIRLSTVQ